MESEGEGRLAAFGDPVLDELYKHSKQKRAPKAKPIHKQPCPSCGKWAYLKVGFFAVLCAECHEGIADCVARSLNW